MRSLKGSHCRAMLASCSGRLRLAARPAKLGYVQPKLLQDRRKEIWFLDAYMTAEGKRLSRLTD